MFLLIFSGEIMAFDKRICLKVGLQDVLTSLLEAMAIFDPFHCMMMNACLLLLKSRFSAAFCYGLLQSIQ